MDETTLHIHERHVFDCENKYGELCPQQEKALEALGIPLPDPEKSRGRNNNRMMAFDLICRNLLFDVCRQHRLEIEEVPEYGGKKYLGKQEFIIQAQKEKIAKLIERFCTTFAFKKKNAPNLKRFKAFSCNIISQSRILMSLKIALAIPAK